jgi:hypothetical protein
MECVCFFLFRYISIYGSVLTVELSELHAVLMGVRVL